MRISCLCFFLIFKSSYIFVYSQNFVLTFYSPPGIGIFSLSHFNFLIQIITVGIDFSTVLGVPEQILKNQIIDFVALSIIYLFWFIHCIF